MFNFPPIPTWDALHPIIIHFPIALFFIAPLFVASAIFLPEKISRGVSLSALGLMTLATVFAFIAVSTGESAGELAERWQPGVNAAIERHEELAETARTVIAVLTGVFAVLAIGPMLMKKKAVPRVALGIAYGVFLILYAPGMLLLANAAHQGGMLVHEYGVHAIMPAEGSAPSNSPDYTGLPARVGDDD